VKLGGCVGGGGGGGGGGRGKKGREGGGGVMSRFIFFQKGGVVPLVVVAVIAGARTFGKLPHFLVQHAVACCEELGGAVAIYLKRRDKGKNRSGIGGITRIQASKKGKKRRGGGGDDHPYLLNAHGISVLHLSLQYIRKGIKSRMRVRGKAFRENERLQPPERVQFKERMTMMDIHQKWIRQCQ